MIAVRPARRWTIGMIVAAGIVVLVGMNAHLLYVAVTSQPDCVAHLNLGEAATGNISFRAAKSSCSGARP